LAINHLFKTVTGSFTCQIFKSREAFPSTFAWLWLQIYY